MRWPGRFESVLQSLIEGRLGRLLGARVQPIEIAKRLADHMDDSRVVGGGCVYVPNSYRAYLAPQVMARFAGSQHAVEQDLCGFLERHARESGYALVGRLRVGLVAEAELEIEAVRVEADMVEQPAAEGPGGGGHTQPIAVAPPTARRVSDAPLVLVAAGRRYPIPPGRAVTVGRALDNDVILDHPSVSRRHARLTPRSGHWLVEDLGSTHGTYVNGRSVSSCLLRTGDELRLGTLHIAVADPGAIER